MTQAFFFTYPNGYGKIREIGEKMEVNFDRYEGHGICLRNGVDFEEISALHTMRFNLTVQKELNLRLELKTVASSGCPHYAIDLKAKTGVNFIRVDVPVISSPLREICIVALREDNEDATSTNNWYQISDVTLN